MQQYLTETKPFEKLELGELVGTSYGFCRLIGKEKIADFNGPGRDGWRLAFDQQPSEILDASNWPDVAVGYTPEFRKQYPGEVFSKIQRFFRGERKESVVVEDGGGERTRKEEVIESLRLMIKEAESVGGFLGRVCIDEEGREVPTRFVVVILSGMFPGRILANPEGGNAYYATMEKAVAAAEGIVRKWERGEMI